MQQSTPFMISIDLETHAFQARGKQHAEEDVKRSRQQLEQLRIVQLAWSIYEADGKCVHSESHIIQPKQWQVTDEAASLHHITTERATKEGKELELVLKSLDKALDGRKLYIGYNIGPTSLDRIVLKYEFKRCGMENAFEKLLQMEMVDVQDLGTAFCQFPPTLQMQKYKPNLKFKTASLDECFLKCFGKQRQNSHDALVDCQATAECYFHMIKKATLGDGLPVIPQTPKPMDSPISN